ncbi:MAG: hydroxyacid dehydrogenase [Clostridia bacterium]|nr:hydroxyacid dehydrogenase [Clostridia bacterium]
MKIVLIESLSVPDKVISDFGDELSAMGHEFCSYKERTSDLEEFAARVKGADIVIEGNWPLTAEMIDTFDSCRYLCVAFSGIDHVDRDAVTRKGITVSNCAGYADDSVAELALTMMISLLRNVKKVDELAREGKTKDGYVGNELRGKTVGIVGMGAIGKRLARILSVFDVNVIFYAPRVRPEALELGKSVSLDELLEKSDIVSLHCPLNDETRGLIGREAISRMKDGAILINTARGPVVDYEALAEALESGKIRGAGIDVYEKEPPLPQDHVLFGYENVITTPHVAFATAESMVKRANTAFDNVMSYLRGEPKNVKIG